MRLPLIFRCLLNILHIYNPDFHFCWCLLKKSLFFLYIVLVGYIAGIAHKLMSDFNAVFYLYLVNVALVIVDVALYYRNERLARQKYGRRRSDAQSDKADKGR